MFGYILEPYSILRVSNIQIVYKNCWEFGNIYHEIMGQVYDV